MKIKEGFRFEDLVRERNKKVLKRFKKGKAEYPKKKDKGFYCPAK